MRKHARIPGEQQDVETTGKFIPFEKKMAQVGIPPLVINAFRFYYDRLLSGDKGFITRKEIVPVKKNEIPDRETLDRFTEQGLRVIKEAVIIKLNGGLGTSMGLSKAKSLIEVKNGLNFLDITARQILSYWERYKVNIPLVLMNSFNTDEQTKRFDIYNYRFPG